jgi:hypothetical protein
MHRLSRAAALALVIAAGTSAATGLGASAARTASSATCRRQVYVTFFVYAFLPRPATNRCWRYERLPQSPRAWHICHWDRPASGSGPNWLYDDTSPRHAPRRESSKIANCAAGRGGLGYEAMARRNGAWRKAAPAGVRITRFYVETYSGENAVEDYFRLWAANPSIGRPVINIGPASPGSTYSAVFHLCRSVRSGSYIGIYSKTPVSPANGKLAQVQNALNACTAG